MQKFCWPLKKNATFTPPRVLYMKGPNGVGKEVEKMAVAKISNGTVLRLRWQTGLDGDGNPVYRSKSLSNVKTDAQDQSIFDVAQALAGLQSYALASVQRVDSGVLEDI